METIKVKTESGIIDTPAKFINGCDELAVTSTVFGLFDVTHVQSGYKMAGGFERCINASNILADIKLACMHAKIDLKQDHEAFIKQIMESKAKCPSLDNFTIIDFFSALMPMIKFNGEFPYESNDDNPFIKLEEKIKQINQNL